MPIPNTPRIVADTSGVLDPAVIERSFFDSLMRAQKQFPEVYQKMLLQASRIEGREATYAQAGSTPGMRRWPKYQDRRISAFDQFLLTVTIDSWEGTVQGHEDDIEDDQSGTIMSRIQALAQRTVDLDIDIMVQLLERNSDPTLLSPVPNDYYGNNFLDGSHTFVSGGNTFSGRGSGAMNLLKDDLRTAEGIFRDMLDEAGLRYYGTGEAAIGNFHVIIPNNNDLVDMFEELVDAEIMPGGFGQSSTKSNVLRGRIKSVTVEPRLSDNNNWFVFLEVEEGIKPFVKVPRKELRVQVQDMESGSDHAFMTKLNVHGADMRAGYGYFEPRTMVEVQN